LNALQPLLADDVGTHSMNSKVGYLTKTLWTYWDSSAPAAFVKLCRLSLEHHAGRGWTVRSVSLASAQQLVDRTDLPEQFSSLRPSFQADSLRLALLRRYGGAWVDATAIANMDIEDWAGAAFNDGRNFVGFYIGHYTTPEGPPLVASWALAVPHSESRVMVAWHEAYLHLWRGNRTSEDGILDDPFFQGASLDQVSFLMREYLHVELVLLVLLQRDARFREYFDQSSQLQRAEDTAYALQASMGLGWMANNRCAPISTSFASLPPETQIALGSSPFIKLRHEDRKWLMEMSASALLRYPESVLGAVLSRNTGLNQTAVQVSEFAKGQDTTACADDA
jgi:hypothetical protein